MGFIADVRLTHDELPLVPTMKRQPDLTLRREYETTSNGTQMQFVSVFGDETDALEEVLADDATISAATKVATFGQRSIYRLTIDTHLEIVPGQCSECGIFVFTATSTNAAWSVRLYLPDRESLAAIRHWYRDHGVSFRVTKLCESGATDEGTYFLTDNQREILLLAYEAGYFDVPRDITQDDLAERLDVTDSAVSQQLRRAISMLIAATLENDRTAGTTI
ncbi:helix-turn-helix domain-containing protein [Natronolimnobius baerhuensis]|uniref:Bacterio-opsin activator n=1 Tax=Natronolimnobius baerhuensis TaxID=253108 RepID=A0A202E711_9EURY|nr:helix-turn-helix domain-containing protein [Natronolimnobius baerhuensis]OVE84051.1 bacterio-opsin activator [Natronolimnobius baerhuensis]